MQSTTTSNAISHNALIEVVLNENIREIEQLLLSDADVNAYDDSDKITPLHFIAQKKFTRSL